MTSIYVCIGSGCHLKGSYQIIDKLKQLLATTETPGEVKLAASFCQGCCTEGVVVKINDELIKNVSPDNRGLPTKSKNGRFSSRSSLRLFGSRR